MQTFFLLLNDVLNQFRDFIYLDPDQYSSNSTIRIQSIQIHITTLFYIFILVERRRTPRSFDLEEDAEQPALNSQVNHDFAAMV